MKVGLDESEVLALNPSEVLRLHEPTATAERGEGEVEKKREDEGEEKKGRVGVCRVMEARGIERRRLSIN